jgi:hypothetical protein
LGEITVDACLFVGGYMKATGLDCTTLPISDALIDMAFKARSAYKQRMNREKLLDLERQEQANRKRLLEEQVLLHDVSSFILQLLFIILFSISGERRNGTQCETSKTYST